MMNAAQEIKVTDLGSNTFAYAIAGLKFEARVGAWDPKNPSTSKYCVTLNADGVFVGKHAGKEYSHKTADRLARAWLLECAAKYS
jgi:hypothetical protein